MKVKLVSASLKTIHIPGTQKPDRRFKTGFRIISEPFMAFSLSLRLSNPEGCFRLHENVITQYGNFRVIAVNNMVPDGEITLIQCRSIERGDNFEFSGEIDIMSGGFVVGESSSYPTPKHPTQ